MRSTTSASAPSTRSACRCCTNSRSKPASIPDSISPTKPRRRASSNRRSTARWRSAAPSRSTMPDVALLFTELGEPRLRKALTALLDRRLVARDALNRFLRGREMTIEAACHRLIHALRGAMSSICRWRRSRRPGLHRDRSRRAGFRSARARDARADGGSAAAAGAPARPARSLSDLVLTQTGRAAQAAGPHQGAVPIGRRLRAAQGDRVRPRPARAGRGRGVQARHQPGAGARRAAAVRDRAGRIPAARSTSTACSISPTCSSAR